MIEPNFVRLRRQKKLFPYLVLCLVIFLIVVLFFIEYKRLPAHKSNSMPPKQKQMPKPITPTANNYFIAFYVGVTDLIKIVPDSAWITKLSFSRQEILISGKTQSIKSLLIFRYHLEKISVNIKLIRFVISPNLSYQAVLKIVSIPTHPIKMSSTFDSLIQQELDLQHILIRRLQIGGKNDFTLQFSATFISVLHFFDQLKLRKLPCYLKISLYREPSSLITANLQCEK